MAESESDIRITTDTPYLALTDELWSVYFENFGENWLRYNGTARYLGHTLPLCILKTWNLFNKKQIHRPCPIYTKYIWMCRSWIHIFLVLKSPLRFNIQVHSKQHQIDLHRVEYLVQSFSNCILQRKTYVPQRTEQLSRYAQVSYPK